MSIRYWVGDTSTDCTAAANWSDDTAPVGGDEVIWDSRTNDYDATTVCAAGDTGGTDYDLLHVKSGHTGDIGAAGAPFHTSAQKIIIEGSGTYYFECSAADAVTDTTIPLVIINNPDCTVYLTSNVNTTSYYSEFTEVIVLAGTVYIGNDGDIAVDTAIETLRISPRNNKSSNVTVYIEEDCEKYKTAATYKMSIYMNHGTLTTDSAATLIEQKNGTLNYGTDLTTSPETGMDITTLRLHGGTFNWYPDDSGDDAFIGTAYLFGGSLNASGTTNNDRKKVLGNGAGNDIFVFEGASLNIANGMGNITIAGSSQLWNFGGTITTDSGTQISIGYDLP